MQVYLFAFCFITVSEGRGIGQVQVREREQGRYRGKQGADLESGEEKKSVLSGGNLEQHVHSLFYVLLQGPTFAMFQLFCADLIKQFQYNIDWYNNKHLFYTAIFWLLYKKSPQITLDLS